MEIRIDLRSDTVTKPTPEMRKVICEAEVGDDVLGDDPTVNKLQRMMDELTGKESALYVPSGTMSNQIAIKVNTQPGDEVICEAGSHIFNYEASAPSFISSVQIYPIQGNKGVMNIEEVKRAIRPKNIHHPVTRLIVVENTHNRTGGTIYPLEEIIKLSEIAKENGVRMHLDGARLWNASIETGISIKEYSKYFDTVNLCFSKGLGAPVGSILVGDSQTIEKARKVRKILGGGMRQAGLLAAACIYAVENNFKRLKEDHENAKRLAEGINSIDGLSVDMDAVHTNIVMIDIIKKDVTAYTIQEKLLENGVGMLAISESRLRAVTHLGIIKLDIDETISFIKKIFEGA